MTIDEFIKKYKLNFNKTENLNLVKILSYSSPVIAYKLQSCANWIQLVQNLENEIRIKKVEFCKNRLCPFCAVMKSRKRLKNFFENSESKKFENPLLFLTLTIPSCEIKDLREKVNSMNKAFHRLKNYPCWKSITGYIRKLEVTRGKTNSVSQSHPHFHCLIEVKKGYFNGSNYIKHEEWLRSWQKAMRDDRITQIDIRRVKGKLELAILETIKYELKPENWHTKAGEKEEDLASWLLEYSKQMTRKRGISTAGSLKKIISKNDDDYLDKVGSEFIKFIWLVWKGQEYLWRTEEILPLHD